MPLMSRERTRSAARGRATRPAVRSNVKSFPPSAQARSGLLPLSGQVLVVHAFKGFLVDVMGGQYVRHALDKPGDVGAACPLARRIVPERHRRRHARDTADPPMPVMEPRLGGDGRGVALSEDFDALVHLLRPYVDSHNTSKHEEPSFSTSSGRSPDSPDEAQASVALVGE